MKSFSSYCLVMTLAFILMACGMSNQTTNEAAEPEIADPQELDVSNVATRITAGEDIFLLDVRTPEELVQDGAIAGYSHIPIDELEARLAEVPMDKPIVAY
jgi:hypothetical protein